MDPQYSMNADIRQMIADYLGQQPKPKPKPESKPQSEVEATPDRQDTAEQEQDTNQMDVDTDEPVDDGAATITVNTSSPPKSKGRVTRSQTASRPEDLPPMFREGGIAHGILIDRSDKTNRKTYRLNPDVPRKDAKVFGHNNIAVGAWFANRLMALSRGAHGASMTGICGNAQGAFSIVVAEDYADLNEDLGDILYYSGSNSHLNDDPQKPAPSTTGTLALKISLDSGRAVRVLRSSKAKTQNTWSPVCGIRYDGLYRVVSIRERTNKKGGLYEQFRLEREPGQTSLETLRQSSPTVQEQYDFAEFKRQ
ncbi:PUA-like domain-containing protein [Rostrohypoxylon terebratum]|nr:PUA-like domain-containing protein [Rostrohypoxylon terebratum]